MRKRSKLCILGKENALQQSFLPRFEPKAPKYRRRSDSSLAPRRWRSLTFLHCVDSGNDRALVRCTSRYRSLTWAKPSCRGELFTVGLQNRTIIATLSLRIFAKCLNIAQALPFHYATANYRTARRPAASLRIARRVDHSYWSRRVQRHHASSLQHLPKPCPARIQSRLLGCYRLTQRQRCPCQWRPRRSR